MSDKNEAISYPVEPTNPGDESVRCGGIYGSSIHEFVPNEYDDLKRKSQEIALDNWPEWPYKDVITNSILNELIIKAIYISKNEYDNRTKTRTVVQRGKMHKVIERWVVDEMIFLYIRYSYDFDELVKVIEKLDSRSVLLEPQMSYCRYNDYLSEHKSDDEVPMFELKSNLFIFLKVLRYHQDK